MKLIRLKPVKNWLTRTLLCQIFLLPAIAFGQQNGKPYQISLQQAISLGKSNNNLVKAAQSEENATTADYKDAKTGALPSIFANGSYQRFTSLTLYDSFLGGAHSVPKRPSSNGADLNVSAAFNLYSGGKQKAFEAEQKGKTELATVGTQEQTANVGLQVVGQYLGMVRLNDQKRFIQEQVVRAETRLKNINALYANQKVTRSDVLRAELVLSSVKLNLEQAENDIIISSQKLNVLLNVPDSVRVLPADSANMARPLADTLLPLVTEAARNAYSIQRSAYNIKIQDARISGIKSNYSPSVSLFSAYGISYPNTIFYPPVDQAYSIGFVGLKVQYNISSLYQNKNKMAAGKTRLQELNYVQQNIKDNVKQEANGLLIKYQESLNRITVTEKSIEQARVNYKIVSAKYFNQLALLTDLLDADNLYQESRFNLVQAQTTAQFIYYQLLYTSGKF
jgi:outer membrane protein